MAALVFIVGLTSVGLGLGTTVKLALANGGAKAQVQGGTVIGEPENTEAAAAAAAQTTHFQYAVKFVCGKGDGKIVAKGLYFTAINVHNPSGDGVGFSKKFAIALPEEKAGPVSKVFDAKLGADEALEIDNADIFHHTESKSDFLKGFVVIDSKVELDVVAVYTAAGENGLVEALHTERVPARRRIAG